jgi:hypothetical protein
MKKKLVYKGENEKEIPRFGVFKPGDEVDFDESLLSTGLFSEKKKNERKDGDD